MKFAMIMFVSGTCALSAPAFASYDKACSDYLSAQPAGPEVEDYLMNWQAAAIGYGFDHRDLSNLELEAWSDLLNGFSQIISFDDGKEAVFMPDKKSQDKFFAHLKEAQVTEVKFVSNGLVRLGNSLEQVCRVLGRTGCEVYENYPGVIDPSPRPLTRRQEQVMKWALFGSMPGPSMLDAFRIFSRRERPLQLERHQSMRTEQAANLVRDVFQEAEARLIIRNLLRPSIKAAYQKFANLLDGKKAH